MKLPATAGKAPAQPAMPAPSAPAETPTQDLNPTPEAPANDLPFEKEPFDAGIDVDEESDPKKFIEKLSGKIGQSLRDYTQKMGHPDFELEKFAINSLISATHTAEMDEQDRDDIIKKINKSGENDSQDFGMDNNTDNENNGNDNVDGNGPSFGGNSEDELDEVTIFEAKLQAEIDNPMLYPEGWKEMDGIFMKDIPKRMSIFAPEGSPEFMEQNRLAENKPCWSGYEQIGMKKKNGKEVPNCVPITENMGESNNYMFWQNLKTIHHASGELLEMNQQEIDSMIANGHAWAVDHIATSADDIEEVYHFMEANLEESGNYNGETEGGYEDEYGNVEALNVAEGEYDGKPLGKPMKGDVKKFKVYVKNKKGNVIKVNFGDPNMEIKRDDPERKKSFRARHKCAQAKDRTTPKYWSCKMWSSTPVSKMVAEDLTVNENLTIFKKDEIKSKLHETFNQETMSEPLVEPIVKPVTKPAEPTPSRRNKPFTIEPDSIPQPDPKANK